MSSGAIETRPAYPPVPADCVHQVDAAARADLWDFLASRAFDPYASAQTLERFLVESGTVVRALPDGVVRGLVDFRARGSSSDVMVIRGLLPDTVDFGPTPDHWSLAAQKKTSYETEMCLIGATTLLGDAFAFWTEHEGNLIQNIVPQQADPFAQTTYGSATFLEWHVEHAFAEARCDYVALLCVRGDPDAATTFTAARNLALDDGHRRVLFEPRYMVGPDDEQECRGVECGPVAVLTGALDDPFVRLDPLFMRPVDPDDTAAAEALAHIAERVPAAARQCVLATGDLLVIDNLRVIHGRTAYKPRFDGRDRWLQKAFVSSSLRKSLVRAAGTRVLDPLAVS